MNHLPNLSRLVCGFLYSLKLSGFPLKREVPPTFRVKEPQQHIHVEPTWALPALGWLQLVSNREWTQSRTLSDYWAHNSDLFPRAPPLCSCWDSTHMVSLSVVCSFRFFMFPLYIQKVRSRLCVHWSLWSHRGYCGFGCEHRARGRTSFWARTHSLPFLGIWGRKELQLSHSWTFLTATGHKQNISIYIWNNQKPSWREIPEHLLWHLVTCCIFW